VLQRRYELCLGRLEVVARLEAQLAAVTARDVAECMGLQEAMSPPDASLQDRTYAEMSVVEEISGVLSVSSAAAGALVDHSRRVCSLPLVLEALSTGAMSWQHARVVADETEGLDAERPDATCNDVPCLNIHCPEAGLTDLPPWEPDNERYVDLDDIPPYDPLWDEFFAASFATRGVIPSARDSSWRSFAGQQPVRWCLACQTKRVLNHARKVAMKAQA